MSARTGELVMTARGRSAQRHAPDRDPSVIACPTCSTLDPPYGHGIMAVTDADGWRHARICATCHGWGRVRRTHSGSACTPAPFCGPGADDDDQEVW